MCPVFGVHYNHWLNNEQIALNILQTWGETQYKYPIDQLIFNPFTGEKKQMISEQYPDIDRANWSPRML
jgi:hypothetical protein